MRRKNATRESTSTLKAWLYEHIKNPYPTKGEKIMLAIITKMTLTQVSTWFANARRRLKKENKMQWSPRNRTGDDDDDKGGSDDDDDVAGDAKDKTTTTTTTTAERRHDDGLQRKEDDEDIIVDGGTFFLAVYSDTFCCVCACACCKFLQILPLFTICSGSSFMWAMIIEYRVMILAHAWQLHQDGIILYYRFDQYSFHADAIKKFNSIFTRLKSARSSKSANQRS